MSKGKVHLSVKSSGEVACGSQQGRVRQARNPEAVTCGTCQRTIAMADAEILHRQPISRRRFAAKPDDPTSGRSP